MKKNYVLLVALSMAVAAGFWLPGSLEACKGTVPVTDCSKSMVMAKAVPSVFVAPLAVPQSVSLPVSLFVICGPSPGATCPNPPVPVSASATLTLVPPGGGPPVTSGTVSTANGTMALPLCSPTGVFNSFTVPLSIPAGTRGVFVVVGSTSVTFSDGMTITAFGDAFLSLVEEAPGQPTLPRLDLEVLNTSPFSREGPGSEIHLLYRITNNDPIDDVHLVVTASSNQIARLPEGGTEEDGVYSISSPVEGDDFPIAFGKVACGVPLSDNPEDYVQQDISQEIWLGPGASRVIIVSMRSYSGCSSGSCSETGFLVQGTFSNGDPVEAAVSAAYYVDTSLPPTGPPGSIFSDCFESGDTSAWSVVVQP